MKKVLVGISGGVDSAVAALLLKNKGYEVIGVTFKFTLDFDINDAKKVCETLGIKHLVVDYVKEFKEKVIDRFINDYKKGITPNPCVLCNRYVKFKFLLDEMKKQNCDFIATGHYANVKDGILYKSLDENKDQTYFLCELTNEELSHVIFPLYGMEKDQVRHLAFDNNLIVADKKDSYDICFINDSFKDYIKDKLNDKKGKVIDVQTNEIVGFHDGLKKYTIGQRRGLDIGGTPSRLFVVGKNLKENILYVSQNEEYLLSTSCILSDINWTYKEKKTNIKAKFRSRQKEVDVKLNFISNEEIEVIYNNVKSVTPGQVCAFYYKDMCIGGGIIKEVRKNNEKLWYL